MVSIQRGLYTLYGPLVAKALASPVLMKVIVIFRPLTPRV